MLWRYRIAAVVTIWVLALFTGAIIYDAMNPDYDMPRDLADLTKLVVTVGTAVLGWATVRATKKK